MSASKINWKLNDRSLKKELLKLSKPQLIKLCKIRKVSINGNKQEIVNALLKKNAKKKKSKSLKSKKTTQSIPPKPVEVEDQKSNETSNISPNEIQSKQESNEKDNIIAPVPLQRVNKIKQPIIKENPNIYILICLYWLRIDLNLTQSSLLIFPMSILKFIHKLSSNSGSVTSFMHSYSNYGSALRSFYLIFNENNNLFQMVINVIKTNDNLDAKLNGAIHYDHLLYFNENCLFEVINGFNYLFNHNKRKKEYIKRTIDLYLLHNINPSIDEIQTLYEDNRIITKDIDYFDKLEEEFGDNESDEEIEDRINNEADFFDYHNIYCEICNKLNEKPKGIYIGGQFRIEKISRYSAVLYFNEYKLCELDNNIFEIWSFITYKDFRLHKPIKLLIDKELNYFEFRSNFGTEYNRMLEFQGKGKFINDELLFENEFKDAFKQFIQLDEKQDIVVVFKETKGINSKGIFINNTLTWDMKRTSFFHGSYYDVI